ncbi:MAG: DNA-3-methyladenine glycosylase [Planctomycetota bacterium]
MTFPLEVLHAGAAEAAPRLLGAVLETRVDGEVTRGRIVETEAYLAEGDGASHSAPGPTERNRAMFGPAGRAYVYLIYGMHLCFNVVTGEEGRGEAVLVRAIEPLDGLDVMRRRRGERPSDRDLARGPGRLTQALAIGREHDRAPLLGRRATVRLLERSGGDALESIVVGPRVGITKDADLPLRFRIDGSRWTS